LLFIVCQHDSVNNLVKISVNAGAFDTTAHTTGVFSNPDVEFRIGSIDSPAPGYFNGLMNQWGMCNKVLSQTEIDWLINSGDGRAFVEIADSAVKLRAAKRDTFLRAVVKEG